jgi:DNA-binding transcriptional ArsR family regulator
VSPVDQFAALADPTRCRVVELLSGKARPVHELAAAFEISRPAISRHLRVLKEAGLVKEEKRGRENVYALQRTRLKPLQDWLDKHRAAPVKVAKAAKTAKPPKPAEVVATSKAPKPARPAKVQTPPSAPLPQLSLDF